MDAELEEATEQADVYVDEANAEIEAAESELES